VVDGASADKTRAEADVQAAEARRQEAEARERVADADQQQREARERHLEAERLDPDVDEREAAEQYDREQARRHGGLTSEGDSDEGGGDRVEHYERTETPDVERERVYEQDDRGDVVRDEERERPR